MKRILTFCLFFISFHCYSQHLEWDSIMGCADSSNPYIFSRVHSIALDEYGTYYNSGEGDPTMLALPELFFNKMNNINGIEPADWSVCAHYSKVYPSRFLNQLYRFDGCSIKRKRRYTSQPLLMMSIHYPNANNYSLVEDFQKNIFVYKPDSIFKIDSIANLLWSKKINIKNATIDRSGNLFVAGDSVFKFDPSGNLLWYYPDSTTKVVTDIHGNCYFRQPITNLETKLDSSGNLVFAGPHTLGYEFAVDTNENVYSLAPANTVTKYDSAGTSVIWTYVMNSNFDLISADVHQNCFLLSLFYNFNLSCIRYARISSLQPPDTITCSINNSVLCANDSLDVYFSAVPDVSSAASFVVQLSDSAGLFNSQSVNLGIGNTSPIKVLIPGFLKHSNHYKIRVLVNYLGHSGTFDNDGFNTTLVSIPVNNISIDLPPVISFNTALSSICYNAAPVNINPTPPGGFLTGSGINGSTFDPSAAGTGNDTLLYTINTTNCGTYTSTRIIRVDSIPALTFVLPADTLCHNSTPVNLSASPAGGVFAGSGITNKKFYPDSVAAGMHYIDYNFTNSCGIFTATDSVFVMPDIIVSIAALPDSLCSSTSSINLVGSPVGGAFSGAGVYGNDFYPDSASVGLNIITYSVIDFCGTHADSDSVFVNGIPLISFTSLPDSTCLNYPSVNLNPNPVGGIFTGNGIISGIFYPDSAGLGNDTITYLFTDSNGCSNSASQIIFIDQCLGVNLIDNGAIIIYPNPAEDKLVIGNLISLPTLTYVITDALSRNCMSGKVENVLDISSLKSGVYFLQILNEKKSVRIKFIKK